MPSLCWNRHAGGRMYRILEKQDLTPVIHLWKVEAPRVARKAQAGQFVMLHHGEGGGNGFP